MIFLLEEHLFCYVQAENEAHTVEIPKACQEIEMAAFENINSEFFLTTYFGVPSVGSTDGWRRANEGEQPSFDLKVTPRGWAIETEDESYRWHFTNCVNRGYGDAAVSCFVSALG